MTRPKDEKRHTFRPADRILRRSEFMRVQSRGQRVHTPHFTIVILPCPGGPRRLGVTVTRKVSSSAVRRNRVKRLVREVFRRNRALFPVGDLVFIAKPGSPDLCYGSTLAEVVRVTRAMGAAARQASARLGGAD